MKELWNKVKKLWATFRAWKYSNYALYGAAAVAVVAVAVVIVLCAVGPKGPDTPTLPTGGSSMDGTNPTSGDSTDNNGGSTDNNGGSTDNNNGGSTDNNNGSSSDNNNGSSSGNNNGSSSGNNNGGSSGNNNGGSSGNNNGGSSGNNNGGSTGNNNTDNVNSSIGESATAGELKFYKTSTHSASKTVSPGKKVSYSVVVTNNGSSKQTVTVTDEIPATAEYVSGCDKVSGNQLKWEFSLGAKESKTITYTLKAKDDKANLGKTLDGAAKVNGTAVPFHKVYIAYTLGNQDQVIMETAIDAFRQSTNFKNLELARWMYYVAFTQSVSYHDAEGKTMTPAAVLDNIYKGASASGGSDADGEEVGSAAVKFGDLVIPTLFGGKGVTAAQASKFMGNQAAQVTKDALMAGDVIMVQESSSDATGKAYIYNGTKLFLLGNGVEDVNTDNVLKALPNAYRYAALRASFGLPSRIDYIDPVELNLTDAQKAVIATAEAYLLRGDRGQYDVGTTMGPDTRYTHGQGSPEEYTTDYWRYSNCSDFTYNCAYFGLGYSGGNNYHTTHIMKTAKSQGVFYYEPTGNETEAERAAKEKEFIDALQPGDVIIVRRTTNTGHAMLYVGNELIIHSTGANYKPSGTSSSQSGLSYGVETYEATFRYRNLRDLFSSEFAAGTYVFSGTVSQLGIYRPLAKFTGKVSEEGMNRVNNLRGIVVEKLGSLYFGQSANVGDEITYTFRLLNSNSVSKTVDITDVIPAGTTLVSSSGWTVSGSNLSCKVTIGAGEQKEVSYKVKVGSNVPDGKIVSDSAKVGGVTVKASTLFVANTLTSAQQQTLLNTINSLSGSSKTGLELANEIYKVAFGVENVFDYTTVKDFYKQMYEKKSGDSKYSFIDNRYYKMVAPGLYGGMQFKCDDDTAYGKLSRFVRDHNLMVGDIVLGRYSDNTSVYLYIGNNTFLDLKTNKVDTWSANSRLERIYGYKYYYVVLRPSRVLDI